ASASSIMKLFAHSLVWSLFVFRAAAEVAYRPYQAGDNFKLLENDWSPLCAPPQSWSCIVGVESGTKNVVAVVVMTVPAGSIEKEVEDAIKAKMPEPSKKIKDGIIGYIDYVEVAASQRGKGIGEAILSVTFKQVVVVVGLKSDASRLNQTIPGYMVTRLWDQAVCDERLDQPPASMPRSTTRQPSTLAVMVLTVWEREKGTETGLPIRLARFARLSTSSFPGSSKPGNVIEDRVITISWMGEVVQSHCVGELGHYVLIGSDRPSSDLDEPGSIPICGMDANLRLALFNHENGADVYIMLLRPAGDTDDPDSAVDSVFLEPDPARSRQLGPEETSVPVRLGPTIDDDEWLTLEYGEAVRWDPESVLHLGDSHTATLSLGDYSRLTPQALLEARAFNTEVNRRVSGASSDCQSSLGNSSPKSRKGRKRRPSSRKGVSFYDDSDPPEENCPPLKQPRRASVVQFDAEAHPI
ncbi:hypothetical protein FOZ60_016481, partial [Perkinsus olseni]